ncbi:hypothetical protein Droror1_Dr00008843 [Drosera rotundifolia]
MTDACLKNFEVVRLGPKVVCLSNSEQIDDAFEAIVGDGVLNFFFVRMLLVPKVPQVRVSVCFQASCCHILMMSDSVFTEVWMIFVILLRNMQQRLALSII